MGYMRFGMAVTAVLVTFAGGGSVPVWARSVEHTASRVRREVCNGHQFVCHVDIRDGIEREWYYIDGTEVGSSEYEHRLSQELLQECRAERYRARQEMLDAYWFQQRAEGAVLQKLVFDVVASCEREYALLEENVAPSFYVFSEMTYTDEERLRYFVQEYLPSLRTMCARDVSECSVSELEQAYAEVNDGCYRLRRFVRETVMHAIDVCDDTKTLKRLLELVS